MSIELQLGKMMEKIENVATTVDKMSTVLDEVRNEQINMKHEVKNLRERVSKIEPIVSNHEDIRKYSRGAIVGLAFGGGAVGGGLASNLKAILALLMGVGH